MGHGVKGNLSTHSELEFLRSQFILGHFLECQGNIYRTWAELSGSQFCVACGSFRWSFLDDPHPFPSLLTQTILYSCRIWNLPLANFLGAEGRPSLKTQALLGRASRHHSSFFRNQTHSQCNRLLLTLQDKSSVIFE